MDAEERPVPTRSRPRSLRVDDPALLDRTFVPSSTPPLSTPPPSRPPRSALRTATPRTPNPSASSSNLSEKTLASSVSSSSNLSDKTLTAPPTPDWSTTSVPDRLPLALPSPSILNRPSFASLSGLLDTLHAEMGSFPDSPSATPPSTADKEHFTLKPSRTDSPLPSEDGATDPPPPPPKLTKRTHALLELLSSERAYASDLALTRDIHIPLALGHPTPLPATPPPSSGSSSRTLSTASDSSTADAPMTKEDARIIFGNIAEIAVFADSFSEQLEEALGSILEGGSGEDRVGELFLKMIPQMLPLYMTYIRRHPTALSHLQSLPQTAALTAYLAHTQTIASSLTHAWDLPSLLIKPVQRLLKYPLLLSTIVEETPDAHPDKAALRRAKEKCEEAAREVNEGRRRYEVVQEVLKGRPAAPGAADAKDGGKDGKRGKPGVSVPVGLAAAVALGKMKNLNLKSARPKEGAEEAERCERYEREIKDAAAFLRAFARHALAWVDAVRASLAGLRQWALGFARVIGLADDAESESEAFDAFLAVVGGRLVPLGATFDGVLRRELLVDAARLVDATRNPLRLLDALHTLEPLHYGLLNMTIGPKSRPPPALLEASQSYVALREQLLQELPDYTALLHRGIVSVVLKFAHWQAEFWGDVHIKWGELWDALRIEDEANNGADETIRVWWNRFAEVEGDVNMLNIVNPQKLHEDPRLTYHHLRTHASFPAHHANSYPVPYPRSPAPATPLAKNMVPSIIASLDPLHAPGVAKSPSGGSGSKLVRMLGEQPEQQPSAWQDVAQHRAALRKRPSRENARAPARAASGPAGPALGLFDLDGAPDELGFAPPRQHADGSRASSKTRSMPVAPRKSSVSASVARSLDTGHLSLPVSMSAPTQRSPTVAAYEAGMLGSNSLSSFAPDREAERGRSRLDSPRKPNFRRKLSGAVDSFRPSSSHRQQQQPQQARSSSRSRRKKSDASQYPHTAHPPLPDDGRFSTYFCQVIHPCEPPEGVQYRGTPFPVLRVGDILEVLEEHGHPSLHRDLPLYVDEGDDCLMLVRDQQDRVGWALASFLLPID